MQSIKIRLFHILFLLCMSVAFSVDAANVRDYGLQINSVASIETEATGLALDAGEPIPLRGKPFTLTFSLYNSKDRPFGCILRMIAQNGFAIDMMNSVDSNGIYRPQIAVGNRYAFVPVSIPWDTWIDVTVDVDPEGGAALIDYNGTPVKIEAGEIEDIRSLRIWFGNCLFEGFTVNSVSSVSVRDVTLKSGDKVIRNWPLLKHTSTSSYDTVCGAKAEAVNPVWIADRNISLASVYSKRYPHFVDVVYDGRDCFYILEPDGDMIVNNVRTGEQSVVVSMGGRYPSNAPNQAKWCNDSTLLSYSIAQNLYGAFDADGKRWSNVTASDPGIIYWNVTSSWDQERSCLYSFGGYGFYHFSNILRVFSPDSPASSSSFTLDRIAPRFFASSVVLDGNLYIFGGEGSFSGNQGIMEEYFYDLYRVDLETFEETLVWDMEEPAFGRFIPGENLVYDAKENCFYTTAIEEKDFMLVKISADAPSIEPMSLPTGIRRDTNIQYTNIYRCDAGDRLYALFIQASDNGDTTVDIMSISLPLLPVADVVLPDDMQEEKKLSVLEVILLSLISGALLLAVAASFVYWLRRRRDVLKYIPVIEEYYDFSRNSISLFGGFTVRDRNGDDITSHFSPTLRKLLSALILHTIRYKQGILGEKLNQLIWDYKPEGTASNNRNVYISRLRSVLESVDGVSINTKNKFLSISLSDDVLCDYKEAVRLYEGATSAEDVSRLLSLLFKGPLLPNMDDEWVEAFRSEYSAMTLTFLNSQLDRNELPDNVRLKVADTIILYDKLNERALKTRCRIYHSAGNIGPAKEAYDTFCREYKAAIGGDYGITFKQIIG